MLSVGTVDVLDAEVVDDQGEVQVPGVVLPEARCDWHGTISVRGEAALQQLVGKDAGLWQAIHAASDFRPNESVDGDGQQIIELDDRLRDHF